MSVKKPKAQKIIGSLLKIFPLLMILLIGLWVGYYCRDITVQDILRYTPENIFWAAAVLIGIYAIKSLSVFFPLLVLYISAGILFDFPLSLLINLAGLWVCVSIPYLLGKLVGREWMEKLLARYQKARAIERLCGENEWFLCYILRVINLLPGDLVSMLLGSMHISYHKFVLGSLAGLLPTMVAATVMGEHILHPTSPAFLIALGMTVIISAASALIYRHMIKKKKLK